MTNILRIAILGSFVTAAACTDPAASPSAAVAQKLGARVSSALVGKWTDSKADLELASDGSFSLLDRSKKPPATTSGSWGVNGSELELISDASDGGAFDRIAWTYAADDSHLGVSAVTNQGASTGPVGTWHGRLIAEQVDATGAATSGMDADVTLTFAGGGAATSHTVTAHPGGAPTVEDKTGTYAVGGQGSITVTFQSGGAMDTQTLSPLAGGYADSIYARAP
jgi:hypothetical protein